MTINRKRLLLWADALDSGEFEQIRDQLAQPGTARRCAEGVGLEVATRHCRDVPSVEERHELGTMGFAANIWYGLRDFKVAPGIDLLDIVDMNDGQGLTFPQIADVLRYVAHNAPDAED